MADVHDKATRSKNMAAVKNKDTKPEMAGALFFTY
jgi:G:T-mismatch repair DNA endonuclease (very short patch repair protein)